MTLEAAIEALRQAYVAESEAGRAAVAAYDAHLAAADAVNAAGIARRTCERDLQALLQPDGYMVGSLG